MGSAASTVGRASGHMGTKFPKESPRQETAAWHCLMKRLVLGCLGYAQNPNNVDIGVKKRCRIMSPDFPGKIIKGP